MVIKSLPKGAHFERFNLNRPVVQARKNVIWGSKGGVFHDYHSFFLAASFFTH